MTGDGLQSRDFTYVDDIAAGTVKAIKNVGFEIINLGGGNKPYTMNHVVGLIEKYLGKKSRVQTLPFPKADMQSTWADISRAKKLIGWQPKVSLDEGIKLSVQWYLANKKWLKDVRI